MTQERKTSGLSPADEVRRRLSDARQRRGYLLPHQGVMAAALPELQDAYPAMYRALTMGERHLSGHEKECVWLAILTACEEHVGTHHIAVFRECGGTNVQAQAILQVAALALGASTVFGFVDDHWASHLAMEETAPLYQSAIARICETGQLDPQTGLLMALGVHTAFSHARGIRTALQLCYRHGVHEGKIGGGDEPRTVAVRHESLRHRGVHLARSDPVGICSGQRRISRVGADARSGRLFRSLIGPRRMPRGMMSPPA